MASASPPPQTFPCCASRDGMALRVPVQTHYDTASLELEPPLGALPLGQPAGGPTSSITSNGTPIHHRLFSGPDSLPAACEPLARAGRVVELPAVPEPGQACCVGPMWRVHACCMHASEACEHAHALWLCCNDANCSSQPLL